VSEFEHQLASVELTALQLLNSSRSILGQCTVYNAPKPHVISVIQRFFAAKTKSTYNFTKPKPLPTPFSAAMDVFFKGPMSSKRAVKSCAT
jgi:hypothetical protein